MVDKEQLEVIKRRLGKRIEDLRIDANITQREVARRAGVNQANLSRIERGQAFPQLDSLLRLQDCFNLDSIEALFGPLPSQAPPQKQEDQ